MKPDCIPLNNIGTQKPGQVNSREHYEEVTWLFKKNQTQQGNQPSGLENDNMQWECRAGLVCGIYDNRV